MVDHEDIKRLGSTLLPESPLQRLFLIFHGCHLYQSSVVDACKLEINKVVFEFNGEGDVTAGYASNETLLRSGQAKQLLHHHLELPNGVRERKLLDLVTELYAGR
eukprot:NODE_8425_length_398_cov_10.871060_g7943_i0.p1 GENE.NODE_8425_length_398_cov_10.871060_g7943_i0~~NODE_8425_length_398_cov_10.871060_g7943_i0.p1  ORF type:complete len:105 (+),score=15.35 NODE_8425_length_398_cov_10.871060_g7943_i0:33-347(+)